MNKRRTMWIAAGLYGIFLIAQFPAHWGAIALARFSQQRYQLIAPEGSVWRGQSAALQIGTHKLDHFSWQLHVLPLLWGTGKADVKWAENSHATVSLTRHALQLQHADLSIPLALLKDFIPVVQAQGLGGDFHVQTPALQWQFDDVLDGHATIEWLQASTIKLPVQPLGDYQIDLKGGPKGVILTISTLRGALTINGTGRWAKHDRFRFAGTLKPDPARQAEFAQLTNLTGGQADAQGTYRLGF